jgi:chorismate dehydratase
MTLRLGIVPYLNVLPLLETLADSFPESGWTRAIPSRLREMLLRGEIDVATLPIFEAFRLPGATVLEGAAIGSDGPVRSVQIFSEVPLAEVRTLALDASSRTSVHLARILCEDQLGVSPEYLPTAQPIGAADTPRRLGADAAVVIGDTALRWEGSYPHHLDLGEGWRRLTGLPFVFAAWVVRPGLTLAPGQHEAFVLARCHGEIMAREIAARHCGDGGIERLDQYLTEAVRYPLATHQQEGIEEFRRRLAARGLVPADAGPLKYVRAPSGLRL